MFENIVDIKSAIIDHPKTSHKLSKTVKQAEKVPEVGSKSYSYSNTKELNIF